MKSRLYTTCFFVTKSLWNRARHNFKTIGKLKRMLRTNEIVRDLSLRCVSDGYPCGANMGPIWGRQDPGGPHVGPMNFVIWGCIAQRPWQALMLADFGNSKLDPTRMYKRLLMSSRRYYIMTSSTGNIFRVTVPLCGESTCHRWIPLTKGQIWCCFIVSLSKLLNKHSIDR